MADGPILNKHLTGWGLSFYSKNTVPGEWHVNTITINLIREGRAKYVFHQSNVTQFFILMLSHCEKIYIILFKVLRDQR